MKDRVLEFLAVRQLRAQQLAAEVEQTGEFPAFKIKDPKDDATPSLGDKGEADRPITDAKEAKARAMAKGDLSVVGRPRGRTSMPIECSRVRARLRALCR